MQLTMDPDRLRALSTDEPRFVVSNEAVYRYAPAGTVQGLTTSVPSSAVADEGRPAVVDLMRLARLSAVSVSESVLARDWLRPEEDDAWRDL
jgi:hypothetical protein